MQKHRVVVFCLGLCALLMLAGCGGNGGGKVAMDGSDTDSKPPMTYTVNWVGLPRITIPDNTVIRAGESMNFGMGQNEVTISCPSGGANCSLMQTGAVVTATGAQATAMLSEGAVIARGEAENRRREGEMARIQAYTVAIADPDRDGSATGGLNKGQRPGGADLTLVPTLDGDITYTQVGTDTDTFGEGDPTVANEFEKSTERRAMIQGWKTGVYHRTLFDRDITDVLAVYTNRGDPTSRSYMSYFANSNAPVADEQEYLAKNRRPGIISGITDYGEVDNTNNADASLNNDAEAGVFDEDREGEGTLFFNEVPTVSEADRGLFAGSFVEFKTNADGTLIDTNEYDDGEKTSGTFSRVPGSYVCKNTSGCTATSNEKGELATLSVGWTFAPNESAAKGYVQNVLIDVDHLLFGYWLRTTTGEDGSKTYGVNTFANGSVQFDDDTNETNSNAAISMLEESVKYNGKATGMYALKSFESGKGVPTASGQFTANANLTANFGGHAVAVDDQFSISGTIEKFYDSEGQSISNGGWSVDLRRADFVSSSFSDSTRPEVPVSGSHYSNSFDGTTTGGGSWKGRFYGSGADTDTANDGVQAEHPTGVAGEFNAHLGNGHVIGAFGAIR